MEEKDGKQEGGEKRVKKKQRSLERKGAEREVRKKERREGKRDWKVEGGGEQQCSEED